MLQEFENNKGKMPLPKTSNVGHSLNCARAKIEEEDSVAFDTS